MNKLICTLGTGRYDEVTYVFGDREKRTSMAPVAVGCCAAAGGELELVALLTQRADETHGEELRAEAEALGWRYSPVRIPVGRSEEELWEIFGRVGEHVEEGDDLVLDLTHGFRHIPALLLLSAVQYYTVRREADLLGIYYGAYEARMEDDRRPILDLTPLIDLPEWSYGVRLLRDYQLPGPLGRMLEDLQRRSHQQRREQRFTRLQEVARPLGSLEAPLVSGLPLEAGIEASRVLEGARKAEGELNRLLPMQEPWEELKAQLEAWGVSEHAKTDVPLTLEELRRQARLVEGYLEVQNLRAAATLMREIAVSAVVLHAGDTDRWLELKERQRAERELGVQGRMEEGRSPGLREVLPGARRELARLWNRITDRRNALAHAGMRENVVKFDSEDLRELHEKIKDNLENPTFWQTSVGGVGEERWLVSPLGMSPGALYTALLKERPDHLLVITSREAEGRLDEILAAAGRQDLRVHRLHLGDPFNGFEEAREKGKEALSQHARLWVSSREVVVNRTGGTTCLGWAAERLEAALRKDLGLRPRTIACVDRRSVEEQRENPYVEGEVIDIGEQEEE
ncbi:CRISPR-associated protein, Csx2 family [Rubrobacter xylanophilus DSM 9941]|uniref:CRISPR-associated protein, Csx2 family n=1 Tax=Rubrobacter xylanophilus (strain DSM 9941 / JCM 11954 / NBRC 16129 / PRD-1) TaxID=266117 RepID=Q1AZD6_RUBXD|nr:TIGR02221 family CRISPR-associated protein [Rubrobacter xylanophilus]ABG03242.1 CRISPR-associated protein, Csx2 family [Rubrobacter xylanophilus DSM 9941]